MISAGVDGYVSLEVSPSLARDSEGTALEGKRLYELLDRPNVMIKVPATPEGIPAVRRLVGQGINETSRLFFQLDTMRRWSRPIYPVWKICSSAGGSTGTAGAMGQYRYQ